MSQTHKQKVLEEVRKQRQRRRAVSVTIIAVILIAIIGVGVYVVTRGGGNANFPFPCLPQEQLNLHVHPWLRITINPGSGNTSVVIPSGVGILDPQFNNGLAVGGSCFEPLHTHDSTGVIHVESQSVSTQYTLGDFFQVWKVTYGMVNVAGVNQPVVFNSTDILGFRTDATHRIWLLVDGNNVTDYGSLILNQFDYCSQSTRGSFPCNLSAGGDPYYGGQPYPFGTGHTIVIYYKPV